MQSFYNPPSSTIPDRSGTFGAVAAAMPPALLQKFDPVPIVGLHAAPQKLPYCSPLAAAAKARPRPAPRFLPAAPAKARSQAAPRRSRRGRGAVDAHSPYRARTRSSGPTPAARSPSSPPPLPRMCAICLAASARRRTGPRSFRARDTGPTCDSLQAPGIRASKYLCARRVDISHRSEQFGRLDRSSQLADGNSDPRADSACSCTLTRRVSCAYTAATARWCFSGQRTQSQREMNCDGLGRKMHAARLAPRKPPRGHSPGGGRSGEPWPPESTHAPGRRVPSPCWSHGGLRGGKSRA